MPAAASDALRESIANAPRPDVAAYIPSTTFKTKEERVKFIRTADDANTVVVKTLTERWKVTIILRATWESSKKALMPTFF